MDGKSLVPPGFPLLQDGDNFRSAPAGRGFSGIPTFVEDAEEVPLG